MQPTSPAVPSRLTSRHRCPTCTTWPRAIRVASIARWGAPPGTPPLLGSGSRVGGRPGDLLLVGNPPGRQPCKMPTSRFPSARFLLAAGTGQLGTALAGRRLRGLHLDPGSGRMVPRTRVGRSARRAAAPPGEGAAAPADHCGHQSIRTPRLGPRVGVSCQQGASMRAAPTHSLGRPWQAGVTSGPPIT